MMKLALTVAVLSLGVAACNKADENAAANETVVENTAELDVNAATNEALEANADAALNAAGNAVENAGEAVENAAEAVENAN
jgi:predicted small secreted protein